MVNKIMIGTLVVLLLVPGMINGQTAQENESSATEEGQGAGEISFGINLIPDLQNDDISDTPVDGLIDDTSYAVQVNYAFPSEEKVIFKFLKVQEYISLRSLRFLSRGESEGIEYAESLEAWGVVYGQRYFVSNDFQGFALGWYAGGAYITTKGHEFVGSTDLGPYEEELFAPLAAFELLFRYTLSYFFVEPNILLAINTSSDTAGFEILPTLIAGGVF